MAKSFWSEGIETVTVRVPLAVVSEAASQLAVITKGLVEANLRSGSTKTSYLVHRLYIEAPTLGYKVRVASFAHLPVPLYPVWASVDHFGAPVYQEGQGVLQGYPYEQLMGLSPQKEPPGTKLEDDPALVQWLEGFLGGDAIKQLVNGLLATVNVGSPQEDELDKE